MPTPRVLPSLGPYLSEGGRAPISDNGIGKCQCQGYRAQRREGQTLALSAGAWWARIELVLRTFAGRTICCHERQGSAQHVPSAPQTGEQEMNPLFPQTCKSRPALGTLPTFTTLPGPPPNLWPLLRSIAVSLSQRALITQAWAPGVPRTNHMHVQCQAHGKALC